MGMKEQIKVTQRFQVWRPAEAEQPGEEPGVLCACNEFLNVMFEMIAIHFIENVM